MFQYRVHYIDGDVQTFTIPMDVDFKVLGTDGALAFNDLYIVIRNVKYIEKLAV